MDFDDWELSVEELDNLERDAYRQIAERNASSSSATTSSCLKSTVSSHPQREPNAFGVAYKRVSFISTHVFGDTHLGSLSFVLDYGAFLL